MDYEIIQINHNSWRIEDSGVRFFLLVGSERALLVDSGRNLTNARDIATTLTDLPISLLNSVKRSPSFLLSQTMLLSYIALILSMK